MKKVTFTKRQHSLRLSSDPSNFNVNQSDISFFSKTRLRPAGVLLDYEQPLFFRSPSSVKEKKKKSARKLGTRRAEATLDGLRKNRACS